MFETFPETARVWVYQSSRPFTDAEKNSITAELHDFARQWVSHNQQLKATAEIIRNQFIILMVDESQVGAGGCSIDKSVAFLKHLQAKYGLELFDRMRFAYLEGEEIRSVSRDLFAALYARGDIRDDTLVIDPLVDTKAAFDSGFIKPLGQSWHRRMV